MVDLVMISKNYVDCFIKCHTLSVWLLSFRGCGTPYKELVNRVVFPSVTSSTRMDPLGRLDHVSQ